MRPALFTVLEMRIWIYWSESNSGIYFYITNIKNSVVLGPSVLTMSTGPRPISSHDEHRYLAPKPLDFSVFIKNYTYNVYKNKFQNLIRTSKFKFSFQVL
jgi:hypothetical protein